MPSGSRHGDRRSRPAAVAAPEPVERVAEEEPDRDEVREAHRAGDVPVDLLERDAEERREEQESRDLLQALALRERVQPRLGGGGAHASENMSLASSSARARRDSRSRCAGESGVPFSAPACQRATSSSRAERIAVTSSGGTTIPAPVSSSNAAAAPSGGTAARIGRSAARYSNTFPERTPRPRPSASGIRSRSASDSRWSSSARLRGAYGTSSRRRPSTSPSAHSR